MLVEHDYKIMFYEDLLFLPIKNNLTNDESFSDRYVGGSNVIQMLYSSCLALLPNILLVMRSFTKNKHLKVAFGRQSEIDSPSL